jgi:hypothetical protein
MSDKKYSVFISSTYEDLKDQREAVLRAILENGHFPLGMEFWGAADEQQWQIIQGQIDVADYYIVIIAHRYGSKYKDLSWTEREYNYAVKIGVPVLGFILEDNINWSVKHIDTDADAKKLNKFKSKVGKKPVGRWKNSEDLRTKVIIALGKQIQATPRTGWVRASQAVSPTSLNELARLSEENSNLREVLKNVQAVSMPDIGFEFANASAQFRFDESFDPRRGIFSADMVIRASLRKGNQAGFTKENCSLSLEGFSKEPIPMTISISHGNGSMVRGIFTIDGPKDFQIHCTCSNIFPPESADFPTIKLLLKLMPIGYDSQTYNLSVSLKRVDNHSGNLSWALV